MSEIVLSHTKTSLAELGITSERNPADILHRPMDIGSATLGSGRRLVVITWPEGFTGEEIVSIFNDATHTPSESKRLIPTTYGDTVLGFTAHYAPSHMTLLQRHLSSPLIGRAMREELVENEQLRLAMYPALHKEQQPFQDRIRLVDLDKYANWFMTQVMTGVPNETFSRSKMEIQTLLYHFHPFLIPFLRSKGVSEEELEQLQKPQPPSNGAISHSNLYAYNALWEQYRQKRDSYIAKYINPTSPEEILSFFKKLPLADKLHIPMLFAYLDRLPHFIDPSTRSVSNNPQDQLVVYYNQQGSVRVLNAEYPTHAVILTPTGEPDEKGFYPTAVTLESQPNMFDEPLVPAIAWIEEQKSSEVITRRFLTQGLTRKLAGTSSAVTTLGRAVATAVSPEMYQYLHKRGKLEQGRDQRSNAIGAAQIATMLLNEAIPHHHLADSIPRRLSRQPLFDRAS